ncbi:DUF4406 domain-containing protein [Marasmitruncus massiliensis]|uniref:DUF7768 domain-containing protein n=1 Tax=Marasmitruncus massiliensis TaxID=1944642 RepID=UPI000C799E6F|nr:DUF4406 domain-containing protein [Marasmitruncus massiliensis]
MARELLYIASPLRGDVEQNIQNAMRYCEKAIREGYIPLAPHVMYQGLFNDGIAEERAAALDIGLRMLEKCSRMWACGDRISEGMRGEMNLAKEKGIPVEEKPESFFTERPASQDNTFRELQQHTQQTVEELTKTEKGIVQLVHLAGRYGGCGVINATAIRTQAPGAQKVATISEWRKMGYRVKDFRNSIKVWMPVEKTGFLRNGRLVDANTAAPAERAAIRAGTLAVQSRTVYRAGFVYDIAQTSCPPREYDQVIGETMYSFLTPEQVYNGLRESVSKTGFSVKESDETTLALLGGWRNEGSHIAISSRMHPEEKLAALCAAFGHGLVEQSSRQPQDVRLFEAGCLSFLLQSRFGVPENLRESPEQLSCSALLGNMGLLEGCMTRVQRMEQFTSEHLTAELRGQGLELSPEQAAKKEQLTEQQREANRNFMQDIV